MLTAHDSPPDVRNRDAAHPQNFDGPRHLISAAFEHIQLRGASLRKNGSWARWREIHLVERQIILAAASTVMASSSVRLLVTGIC
jgi:hypothetical protein